MLPTAMTDHTDEAREEELDAREHLIDAEVEAQETLEEAERLEDDSADRRAEDESE